MKTKDFDCVEMKRRGAEVLYNYYKFLKDYKYVEFVR